MKKVEQIDKTGKIILAKDNPFTKKEISAILKNFLKR